PVCAPPVACRVRGSRVAVTSRGPPRLRDPAHRIGGEGLRRAGRHGARRFLPPFAHGGAHARSVTLEPSLDAINHEMRQQLAASSPTLEPFYEMMRYHLALDAAGSGSGKRLRPLLCLLAYEALGGQARDVLPAAAALELLHNFTLIHDDIEDQDCTRHHRPAVWAVWGVAHAINAGDGMYALSRVA